MHATAVEAKELRELTEITRDGAERARRQYGREHGDLGLLRSLMEQAAAFGARLDQLADALSAYQVLLNEYSLVAQGDPPLDEDLRLIEERLDRILSIGGAAYDAARGVIDEQMDLLS